jgi:hypothetical protein
MTRTWRIAAVCGAAALAAGCASASAAPPVRTESSAAPSVSLSLNTAQTSADGSWATIPMGATGPNLFWQLFRLPKAGGDWSLETPPDIATNGAVVLAPRAGTLVTGIRPSLDLTFSPVTATADGGGAWTTLPPDSGLANVPDSLAAAPDGDLMSLDTDGQITTLASGGASWTTLTSEHALATGAATRGCEPTAVAYTSSGTPLLGATCAHAGVTGIFAYTGGAWHLTGPALSDPAVAGQRVQVLRLTRTGDVLTTVLEAGTSLYAAWSADDGVRWTVSPAYQLGAAQPVSVSFGSSGGLVVALSDNHAETLAGRGASWQSLPSLPVGRSVTLALTAPGTVEALAADGGTLTVWRHTASAPSWVKAQSISVPIQYGSSS